MPIPVPVELDFGQPQAGGFLTSVRSLPAGWQSGVSFTDTACLAPVVMGECPSGQDLKPGQCASSATFRPVSVIQAVECSTLGGFDVASVASAALGVTADYALAYELLTGEASERDHNPNVTDPGGNPALVSSAVDLGTATTLGGALACLDQNLHAATAGRGGVILVGVDMINQLMDASLIWRDGTRWRTAAGTLVLASAGFDGRAPVDSGSGAPPDTGDPLYMYATAGVWAGVGEVLSYGDVNRSVNTSTSRAEEVALVAFSPCAVFAAATNVVTKCGSE